MNKSLLEKYLSLKLYLKLLECTRPENLDNTDLIFSNIRDIRAMKPFLSEKIYDSFMKVIVKHIQPIIDDNTKFLSSLHTSDIGFFNDDGNFEIKGEYELKLFFTKLCQLSLDLERIIEKWAESELSPYFS